MNAHDDKLFATTLLAALAGVALLAFGGAASAQEATPDTWIGSAAAKSRAEVQTELAQAHADGSMRRVAANYDFVADHRSVKSREQVRDELLTARESGEFAAINGEVYGYTPTPVPLATDRLATRR